MWLWCSFVYIYVVGDLLQIHMGKCFSTEINIYLVRLQRNVTAMIKKFQNDRRCRGNYESINIFLIRL
jgi:hypothetical protein